MKKILSILIMSAMTLAASAQNVGWQTGGGYNNNDRNRHYHYDLQSQRHGRPDNMQRPYHHRADYFDLFSGDHEDAPYAFTVGYVNKYWRTNFGTHVWHENFWGEEGKRLHGIQLGFTYQPCLPVGLGLHTGLMWEAYISVSPAVKEMGWDNFTEHNLYLPLHAAWRIPIDRECSISFFGGLGVNWAMFGQYNDEHDDDYYDWYDGWIHEHWTESEYAKYGRGDWPHHLNLSTEFGATVRIKRAQVSLTFSRGITDHDFYKKDGNYKTTQNKVGLSVSFLLNDSDF